MEKKKVHKELENLVERKNFEIDKLPNVGEVSGELVLEALCRKLKLDRGEIPEEENANISISQKRAINYIFREYVGGEYIPYPEVNEKKE